MRIQNHFLTEPSLSITMAQAQRRFGVDALTCDAVLALLVDSGVLARTPDGRYARLSPRTTSSSLPRHAA